VGGQSLALSVPSTLVPQERNLLLNPAHPAFKTVVPGASSAPFDLDLRLAR